MRERNRHTLPTIKLIPGDILHCAVDDRAQGMTHHFYEKIGREMTVDTLVTFDVTNEFGLANGIGAIFGEANA